MKDSPFQKSIWAAVDPEGNFDCFREINNADKEWLALDALAGGLYEQPGGAAFTKRFHTWLSWVQSDHPRALLWWHWMSEQEQPVLAAKVDGLTDEQAHKAGIDLRDRDKYIQELWHTINQKNSKNSQIRKEVEAELTPWTYYTQHFFNWFLQRYDTIKARQVLNRSLFCRYIHIPLSLVCIFLTIWHFNANVDTLRHWSITGLEIILTFVAGSIFAQINIANYMQSLIPRFAATIAIGYLFLFSANSLVKVLQNNFLTLNQQIAICLIINLLVYIYMIQVIQRQVKPRLGLWTANKRAFPLMLIGSAYSAIGLWACAPILFSNTFLELSNDDRIGITIPSPGTLLLTATIALAIGVVLQMVWEDKPVTEPL